MSSRGALGNSAAHNTARTSSMLARSRSDGAMPRARSASVGRRVSGSLDVDSTPARPRQPSSSSGVRQSMVGTWAGGGQRQLPSAQQSLPLFASASGSSSRGYDSSNGQRSGGISQLQGIPVAQRSSDSSGAINGPPQPDKLSILLRDNGDAAVAVTGNDAASLAWREVYHLRREMMDRERSEVNTRAVLLGELDGHRAAAERERQAHASERAEVQEQIEKLMRSLKAVQSSSRSEASTLSQQLASVVSISQEREAGYRGQIAEQASRLETQAREIAQLRALARGEADPSAGPTIASLQKALHEALGLRSQDAVRAAAEAQQLRTALQQVTAATEGKYAARLAELQGEVGNLQVRLHGSEARETDLQQGLARLSSESEGRLAAAEQQAAALKQQLDATQAAASGSTAALQSALDNAQAEMASLRSSRDSSLGQLEGLRADLSSALAAKDSALQAMEGSMKDAVTAAAGERATLQALLSAAREDATHAREEASSARRALLDALAKASATEAGLRREVAAAHDLAAEAVRAKEAREASAAAELTSLTSRLEAVESTSASAQAELASLVGDLRSALEEAEGALARQVEQASATLSSCDASWRAQADSLTSRALTLQQQLDATEGQIRKEREAAAAREASLQSALSSTRQQLEESNKTWSARVAALESHVARLQEEGQAMVRRLKAATEVRSRLGLAVAQAVPASTVQGQTASAGSASTNSQPLTPSLSSTTAAAGPGATDAFVAGVMNPRLSRRASMMAMAMAAQQAKDGQAGDGTGLSRHGSMSSMPGVGQGLGEPIPSSSSASGLSRKPSMSALEVPGDVGTPGHVVSSLPPELLSLAETWGACTLATTWLSHRSAAATAHAALSKSVTSLSDRLSSVLGSSESARAGLAGELNSLRAAVAEAQAGRTEARQALDAVKLETEAVQQERQEQLASALAAVQSSAAALGTALSAAQQAAAACSGERGALETSARATEQRLGMEIQALRSSLDSLRSSMESTVAQHTSSTQSLAQAHRQEVGSVRDGATHDRQALEARVRAAEAAREGAVEELQAERSSYELAAASVSAEVSRLSATSSSTMVLYEGEVQARAAREQEALVREGLMRDELARLGSAAVEAASQSEGAVAAVRAHYEEWHRRREEGAAGLRAELEGARAALETLHKLTGDKSQALTIALDALSAAVAVMKGSEGERERMWALDAEASSRLNGYLREACGALAARLQQAREKAHAEVDAVRSRLNSQDSTAATRLTTLLGKAQVILQKAQAAADAARGSGHGHGHAQGLLSGHDTEILRALVDRLAGKGQAGQSPASLALAELTEKQHDIDRQARALAEAASTARADTEKHMAEVGRLQAVLDKARVSYTKAASAATVAASTMALGSMGSGSGGGNGGNITRTASSSSSSGFTAPAPSTTTNAATVSLSGPAHVGRGLGLTSPELHRTVSMSMAAAAGMATGTGTAGAPQGPGSSASISGSNGVSSSMANSRPTSQSLGPKTVSFALPPEASANGGSSSPRRTEGRPGLSGAASFMAHLVPGTSSGSISTTATPTSLAVPLPSSSGPGEATAQDSPFSPTEDRLAWRGGSGSTAAGSSTASGLIRQSSAGTITAALTTASSSRQSLDGRTGGAAVAALPAAAPTAKQTAPPTTKATITASSTTPITASVIEHFDLSSKGAGGTGLGATAGVPGPVVARVSSATSMTAAGRQPAGPAAPQPGPPTAVPHFPIDINSTEMQAPDDTVMPATPYPKGRPGTGPGAGDETGLALADLSRSPSTTASPMGQLPQAAFVTQRQGSKAAGASGRGVPSSLGDSGLGGGQLGQLDQDDSGWGVVSGLSDEMSPARARTPLGAHGTSGPPGPTASDVTRDRVLPAPPAAALVPSMSASGNFGLSSAVGLGLGGRGEGGADILGASRASHGQLGSSGLGSTLGHGVMQLTQQSMASTTGSSSLLGLSMALTDTSGVTHRQ